MIVLQWLLAFWVWFAQFGLIYRTINAEIKSKSRIELIENNEIITKRRNLGKLNMINDWAKYHIKELTEEGYIKHIGNPLTGKWVILTSLH